MKILIDFFPIIIFFIAFKFYDIYIATIATMVATVLQLFYLKIFNNKIEKMHWISAGLLIILGSATILLENEWFIKLKVTVLNLSFALIFLISPWFLKKTIIQKVMENILTLPNTAWNNINYAWIIFFILSGMLNLYVAYNFSTDIWVNFKLFGMLGLTVIFIVAQSLYMYKYIKTQKQ